MLDSETFKTVIESTPLGSIELCLVGNGQILSGRRTNEPPQGRCFTPGGRIHKNQSSQAALKRVALAELSLPVADGDHFELTGIWDHFYPNCGRDEKISNHYVKLLHFFLFKFKPAISGDNQHHNLVWFDLDGVVNDEGFHQYARGEANNWINNEIYDVRN